MNGRILVPHSSIRWLDLYVEKVWYSVQQSNRQGSLSWNIWYTWHVSRMEHGVGSSVLFHYLAKWQWVWIHHQLLHWRPPIQCLCRGVSHYLWPRSRWLFEGWDHDHFLRAEISTERTIVENESAPLHLQGNENFYGKTHDLLPEYAIFNNIFWNTLTPKWGDCTSIRGSTRNLLLAILDNSPPPCISTFLWIEFMFMLNHGTTYMIYAPYIQRIINYKADMEFGYDAKHRAYQPHIVWGSAVPPPPSVVTTVGTSSATLASFLVREPSPSATRRSAPLATPESSRTATRRGKKPSILVLGLKTLISMCHSNDALIRESHQQMSQRLSTLEER
jgi:hypothetical protein